MIVLLADIHVDLGKAHHLITLGLIGRAFDSRKQHQAMSYKAVSFNFSKEAISSEGPPFTININVYFGSHT